MSFSPPACEKLKILCIHGYRQNAQIFRERTGALRKIIKKCAELVYISAPNKVQSAEGEEDLDQRGWWFSTTDHTFKASQLSDIDHGLQDSLDMVATVFKELGPFDGILAFSQGAAFAAILCALQSQEGSLKSTHGTVAHKPEETCEEKTMKKCSVLEVGGKPQESDARFHFKFAILIASFRSLSSNHTAFYTNAINCPTLHVFGDTDGVIPKESSEELLPVFVKPQVLNHPGGHFVPTSSPQKKVYLEFLEHWYTKKQEDILLQNEQSNTTSTLQL